MPYTKEEKKEYNRKYSQTEKGKKHSRIYDWKRIGVICDDFDLLYDKYLSTTHCELCSVQLTVDKKTKSTTRCLDHDHKTGLFRNVVCNACNVKREYPTREVARKRELECKKKLWKYQSSWGGDQYRNHNNNLLKIDPNLFY